MTSRERRLLLGSLLVLAAVVAVQFGVRPALRDIARWKTAIPESEKALEQLRARSQEYSTLQSDLAAMRQKLSGAREQGGALPALERLGRDCGLAQNVAYMRPDTSPATGGLVVTKVTIKVEGASFDQITQFLQRIQESEPPMGVRSLRLSTASRNPSLLDASLEVISVTASPRG